MTTTSISKLGSALDLRGSLAQPGRTAVPVEQMRIGAAAPLDAVLPAEEPPALLLHIQPMQPGRRPVKCSVRICGPHWSRHYEGLYQDTCSAAIDAYERHPEATRISVHRI